MGLLGKSKSMISSRIWRSKAETLKGIAMEAMKEMKAGNSVLVIAFFDSGFDECREFFLQKEIPFSESPGASNSSAGGTLFLAPASRLDVTPLTTIRNLGTILFYGRYPLQSREEMIIRNAPPVEKSWFCASLEDRFFQVFGSNEIATLMKTLGMKQDEFIEHKMVDKAIARAQEKLGEKVRNELKANSEDEWFQKNIRE